MIEQAREVSARRLVESLVVLEQEAKDIGWLDVGGLIEVALRMAVGHALELGSGTPALDAIAEARRSTDDAVKTH